MLSFCDMGSLRGAGLGVALAMVLAMVAPAARAAGDGPRLMPDLGAGGAQAPEPLRWMALEFAVGAGAAVVAVPVAMLAGAGLGSLSSNLVLAAAPALLLFAALPPLAVAGLESWFGNRLAPGRGSFRPAVWVALAVHVLATGAAIALGASARNWRDVALLTLGEAIALPAAVTLTMYLSRPSAAPPPPPPSLTPPHPARDAARPNGLVVPLVAFNF
ncbi:hypothetical protein P2318_33840 [Myxococcaceae bacterium GXIMD 01537]